MHLKVWEDLALSFWQIYRRLGKQSMLVTQKAEKHDIEVHAGLQPIPPVVGKEGLNNNNDVNLTGSGGGGNFDSVLAITCPCRYGLRAERFRLEDSFQSADGLLKTHLAGPHPRVSDQTVLEWPNNLHFL